MAKAEKKGKYSGSQGQNRKKSDDFLAKNRKKTGVVETESGLQYFVMEEGDGARPSLNSIVTVNQRAMLIGGKILDDTYQDGKTLEFKVSEVVEGYCEGLQLMSVGSRYKFFVPPELAWGKKGSGGRIGPYAVVIYDVALVNFY